MKIRQFAGFVGFIAVLAACGSDDDDKPAAQAATVNKSEASQSARSTITALSGTTSGKETGSSASALSAAAQSSQSLLTPSPGAGTKSIGQAFGIEGGDIHPLDIGDPGCTCTATSCTFANCSFGASGSAGSGSSVTFSIDGSYSWDGGHIVCKDLKYTFGGTNLGGQAGGAAGLTTNTVVTLQCDITITSTSINGTLRSAGTSSSNIGGQSYNITWDVSSNYKAVTFDATSHEPTGGTLSVSGTETVNAGGNAVNFAGSADIAFP